MSVPLDAARTVTALAGKTDGALPNAPVAGAHVLREELAAPVQRAITALSLVGGYRRASDQLVAARQNVHEAIQNVIARGAEAVSREGDRRGHVNLTDEQVQRFRGADGEIRKNMDSSEFEPILYGLLDGEGIPPSLLRADPVVRFGRDRTFPGDAGRPAHDTGESGQPAADRSSGSDGRLTQDDIPDYVGRLLTAATSPDVLSSGIGKHSDPDHLQNLADTFRLRRGPSPTFPVGGSPTVPAGLKTVYGGGSASWALHEVVRICRRARSDDRV